MRILPYWIQRADFSSSDFGPVDVTGAIRAFTMHDWHVELDFQSQLEIRGDDCCPPGIGYHDTNGSILHVCPDSEEAALVHYHAETVTRLFGFIPTRRSAVRTKNHVEQSQVLRLIELFFNGQHEDLLRIFADA